MCVLYSLGRPQGFFSEPPWEGHRASLQNPPGKATGLLSGTPLGIQATRLLFRTPLGRPQGFFAEPPWEGHRASFRNPPLYTGHKASFQNLPGKATGLLSGTPLGR